MKFNDTVFEHYNDDENIDFAQSHDSETDIEPNEEEELPASNFQKLLDKFVTHIMRQIIP